MGLADFGEVILLLTIVALFAICRALFTFMTGTTVIAVDYMVMVRCMCINTTRTSVGLVIALASYFSSV